MSSEKSRHTVWLRNEAWENVVSHYRMDDCTTQNEYIEKAIQFYTGYLDTERSDLYLPRVLSEMLEGKLDMLGQRIGTLLFKLAVESNISNHLLAADTDMDMRTYEKLRGRSVREVKETNGRISFKDDLRFQKSL